MLKCCATKTSILPEGHQVFRWGVLTPLLLIPFRSVHTNKTSLLNGRFRLSARCSWGYCLGYAWVHYKNDSLFPHQFLITNLILLISGCICTGTLEHISKHMGQISLNNNIIIWLHFLAQYWFYIALLVVINYACVTEHTTHFSVHVCLPVHATWLHFIYSLGCFLTTLELHV